jgi:hypothetical protein
MRLATGLAFVAGLAVASFVAALDRQQWEGRYVTALQAKATADIKSDKH